MPEPILLREDRDAIATLTLNRPQALNALSDDLLAALSDQIAALRADRSVRVVILRGAGRAFCAGHDLKEMQASRQAPDGGRAAYRDLFARCSAVMLGLTRLPQIVVAQVHGIATAAGCQLVGHCDLAVAAEDARFGVNGVNIGLFCSTPMVALSRNIPRKRALELLVTGDFLSAPRAAELGLVNRVSPPDMLEADTRALAAQIAAKLGRAVAIGKETFYAQAEMGLDDAYAHAGRVMAENMLFDETREGIDAFLAKREPEWRQ
ncbi:enoyl-CoA hydratase [Halovulum dunhuangense]|uniref:Enoyl-CoA hydratase domain-containing protein 3, mitochondrial n=1 Tax=Halovulum dunhuangense TaxID=1505036 RepID=A0A849L313_9RHOB|nr:enoyl-CoA hydratase [Halovulum dunhuangense]NNU80597.1 enoyl-CoA hydratase [Halovulum dunhuangense]